VQLRINPQMYKGEGVDVPSKRYMVSTGHVRHFFPGREKGASLSSKEFECNVTTDPLLDEV